MSYDEIAEIRRLAGLVPLEEAAPSVNRLTPMFDALLKLVPALKKNVDREIDWARTTLEREDRVIWYLRLVQLAMLEQASEADSRIGETINKKIKQFAQKSGTTPGNVQTSLSSVTDGNVKRFLTHFLSMPISGIQNYIFSWQLPAQVYDDFSQLENDWKEDQKRTVPHDPRTEVVIDFGDGYAWYDLETAYCSDEAEAMGHCGNSPRQSSTDNILSLRRKQQVGNEIVMTPVLTFILDDNGLLGEMKGRGNDKPAERYHKYIIPLLRHDIVKGIKGGGYMPENNFSMNDLDDEIKDELIDEKPGLEGPLEIINRLMRDGDYDSGIDAIRSLAHDHGLRSTLFDVQRDAENWAHWTVHLESYSDYETVAREVDDVPVISLFDALEGIEDFDFDVDNYMEMITLEVFSEIAEKLPHPQQDTLIKGTGQSYTNRAERYDALSNAVNIIFQEEKSNRFYQNLMYAIVDTVKENEKISPEFIDKVKIRILERLKEYADGSYPMNPMQAVLHPKEEDNWKEGNWFISMNLGEIEELIDVAISGEEDDEYYHNYLLWSERGLEINRDNWHEDRNDEYGNSSHLTQSDEQDPIAIEVEEGLIPLEIDDMIDEIAYNFAQRLNIIESKKTKGLTEFLEESFDHDYEEIMRLAGVRT